MKSLMEGMGQLERGLMPEPMGGPAAGSLALHGLLLGGLLAYGVLAGFFHHNLWGNPGTGGAIQVSLVSSAIPLPAVEQNKNVLMTETPSQAPAEPTPKAKQAVDETAIPIQGKQVKPQPKTAPKTQQHQPQPRDNRAQYGEQAGSILPRATLPQGGSNGPTSVGDGDFASRFGWYVDGINRKMATTWDKREVDPRTPKGIRVFLVFTIHRDGSPADVQVDRSSGSATLDRSCQRGVQRVDTFGQLPAAYNSSTLKVSYYCEY
jgi:protein TonB